MARVRFVDPAGNETDVSIDDGVSVMEGAIKAGIDGIDADCGGQLSCATCHVYLGEAWLGRVPEPNESEDALLEFAAGRQPNSRLSCQIIVQSDLEGLEIRIPVTQGS